MKSLRIRFLSLGKIRQSVCLALILALHSLMLEQAFAQGTLEDYQRAQSFLSGNLRHVKLRLRVQNAPQSITVNGRPTSLAGRHNDRVIIRTGNDKQFEVVGQWG